LDNIQISINKKTPILSQKDDEKAKKV
jgi:hypothetical protein